MNVVTWRSPYFGWHNEHPLVRGDDDSTTLARNGDKADFGRDGQRPDFLSDHDHSNARCRR